MKNGLGRRGVSLALAAMVLAPLVFSLLFYPTAHMELKNLPFGVLSLDEGVETPMGQTNIGDAMVEAMEGGASSMMSGMLSRMVILMPLLTCSLLAGALVAMGLKVRAGETAGVRAKRYVASLAVDAVAALVLVCMLFWVITFVAGLPVEFGPFAGYCWLVSFLLMAFFGGLACIRGRVAAVVGALILVLGMTSAYLPVEAMPAFWQDWVVPWAPEYYMGNGLREVVFAGGSVFNSGAACVGICAAVGVCCAALGIGMGNKLAEHGRKQR